MPVIDLTAVNFDEIVHRDGIALVDCWAEWCGGCDATGKTFAEVADRYPSHRFAKLDAGFERALTASLGIVHIPSLLLYRDGILLFREAGTFDEEFLEKSISMAESLDMGEVREAIAAEQGDRSGQGEPRAIGATT